MKIKLNTPLLHKFYDWAMSMDANIEVPQESWDTCFVGKFHKFDNNIDDNAFYVFMPIYGELNKVNLINSANSISNLCNFGELQNHLHVFCEKV